MNREIASSKTMAIMVFCKKRQTTVTRTCEHWPGTEPTVSVNLANGKCCCIVHHKITKIAILLCFIQDRIVFSDFMLTWKKNIFIYKNVTLSKNSENHR